MSQESDDEGECVGFRQLSYVFALNLIFTIIYLSYHIYRFFFKKTKSFQNVKTQTDQMYLTTVVIHPDLDIAII